MIEAQNAALRADAAVEPRMRYGAAATGEASYSSESQSTEPKQNFAKSHPEAERVRALSTPKGKRYFDLSCAIAAVIFLAPLMGLLYLLVRRDGGPGIFVQQRVGKDGVLFPCYKFRTMVPDAETTLQDLLVCNEQFRKDWEADRKLRNDPRITSFGAFLRRKSLDELPQLFNVIRGDMSLVGPRPIVPDEREKYGQAITYYMRTRPGLTGLWQVSGRNDISYAKRVELDTDYTRSSTWMKDFAILLKTVGVVVTGRGAL